MRAGLLLQGQRVRRTAASQVEDCIRTHKPLMCSYKLCRVEFKYWGLQQRIENFIHDVALRRTMVTAHRQAWAWQDEWWGLTIDDIRRLERQAQLALNKKVPTISKTALTPSSATDGL